MKKNQRILREYIRETLSESRPKFINEEGVIGSAADWLKSVGSSISSKNSGPRKWFADFLDRKLDSAHDDLVRYLNKNFSGNTVDNKNNEGVKDAVSKAVALFVQDYESKNEQGLSNEQQKDLADFSLKFVNNGLRKGQPVDFILKNLQKELNNKFSNLSKKKSDDEEDK